MSTDLTPAGHQVIALIDEAERALAEASSPVSANELWRKARAVEEAARLAGVADAELSAIIRVRLRTRRRWGELLGPAETGANQHSGRAVTRCHGSDRKAVERARKLAAVPVLLFAAHLEQEEPEQLTEAGLFRVANPLARLSEKAQAAVIGEASTIADSAGRGITVADVRVAVQKRLPEPPTKEKTPPEPEPGKSEPPAQQRVPKSDAEKLDWLVDFAKRVTPGLSELDLERVAGVSSEADQRRVDVLTEFGDAIFRTVERFQTARAEAGPR